MPLKGGAVSHQAGREQDTDEANCRKGQAFGLSLSGVRAREGVGLMSTPTLHLREVLGGRTGKEGLKCTQVHVDRAARPQRRAARYSFGASYHHRRAQ